MGAVVIVNLKGMDQVLAALKAGPKTPEIRQMFRDQATVYRQSMLRHFSTASRGGGDWAPLKPATIARKNRHPSKTKRKTKISRAKAGGRSAILVDTGLLRHAVSAAEVVDTPTGLEVRLPDSPHGGGMTTRRLAKIHNDGTAHIPARRIFIDAGPADIRHFERLGAIAVRDIAARSTVR